jgi:Tol biopolymer transport system component
LVDTPGSAWYPAWSPDGRYLAFNTDDGAEGGLYLIEVDGGLAERLPADPIWQVAWSPDGTRLLFYSNKGQGGANAEIYAANLDGTGRTALSSHPTADNHPRWRPEAVQ